MYNLAIRGGGKLSNILTPFLSMQSTRKVCLINDDIATLHTVVCPLNRIVSKRFKVGAALGYTMTKTPIAELQAKKWVLPENGMSDPMYRLRLKREKYTATTELRPGVSRRFSQSSRKPAK